MVSMKKKGSVLVLALFMGTLLILLGGALLQLTVTNLKLVATAAQRAKTEWVAKAGLNKMYYDLKNNYFQNEQAILKDEMGSVEIEYAGGVYKAGTATLIGQGFHRSLLVSCGYYGKKPGIMEDVPIEDRYENKVVLTMQVEMSTLTDYLYFREVGRQGIYNAEDSYYFGPVHVNGNANIGFLAVSRGNEIAYCKNKDDYGPVLRASGKVLFRGGGTPGGYYCGPGKVLFAEGTAPLSWGYSDSDWPVKFFAAKDGINLWPAPPDPNSLGIGWNAWDNAYDTAKEYKSDIYPTTITKTALDGTEYKYDLVQDKSSGVTKINMPGTTNINYNYFKRYITDEWHFKKDAPVYHGKKIKITNDVLDSNLSFQNPPFPVTATTNIFDGKNGYGFPGTSLGLIYFTGGSGFEVKVPPDIDMDYVRHVFLVSSDTNQISAGCSFPVGNWQNPMTSYTVDRVNRKIKFKYPVEWAKGVFESDPVAGKWRRKFARGDYETATASATVTVMPGGYSITIGIHGEGYGGGDGSGHAWPYQVSLPVRPASDEVYMGNILWTRLTSFSDADMSTAGFTNAAMRAAAPVYTINNTTGTITFGDNVHGATPPLTTRISVVWEHEESPYFEVRLPESVEVVKMDLSEITADNCPRDPKDPSNPDKYGIIFSEMPMMVYGVPKVPVTIVCMEDLYVGPINSQYLKNTTPDPVTSVYDSSNLSDVSTMYPPDSIYACPVGLMSAKVMYLDLTYAPVTTAGKKVWANAYCEPWTRKTITLNKVALFHSVIRDYLRGSEFIYQYTPNYANQMGLLTCNGLMSPGDGWREWRNGGTGLQSRVYGDTFWSKYRDSYSPNVNAIQMTGSVYNDVNYDIVNWVNKDSDGSGKGGKKRIRSHWVSGNSFGYDDQSGARRYASSFRSWNRSNPAKSGPPPNMPKEIKRITVDFADDRAVGAFLTELENLMKANQSYSDDYGKALSELQSSLYH